LPGLRLYLDPPAVGLDQDAAEHSIRLEVIKLPEAKHGFGLLPRRWGACFRSLAKGDERLPELEHVSPEVHLLATSFDSPDNRHHDGDHHNDGADA
jgi:hypothetical protein